MDWDNFENMDPHLLVGVVNTEIRNNCGSLAELCKVHNVDAEAIKQKLGDAGYDFMEAQEQFR